MSNISISDIKEIMEAVHYWPSISIIMPFLAKINLETELKQSFKVKLDEIERELKDNYPEDISKLMVKKLKIAIDKVDLNVPKNGVAIYVSPVFEKIVYLDVLVKERIIIDESFEIRDMLYSKKNAPNICCFY